MLASRVSGNRVLAVVVGLTLVAGFALLPAAEEPAPEPMDSYRFVPLSGDLLAHTLADGRACLPFLAPLTAHPRWQVQIAHAFRECMGPTLLASFSISSDGKVVWSAPGMPDRELALTPAQLATVRGLDRLDCVRTDEVGYSYEYFSVGIGGGITVDGGAVLPRHSTLGDALATLFDELLRDYYARRFAAFQPIAVDLTLDGYQLALRGTDLTVRRGGRTWVRDERDVDEVVDLLDTMIDGPETPHEHDGSTAFGSFTASGITVPLAVSRFERGAAMFLARGFEDAIYIREQR